MTVVFRWAFIDLKLFETTSTYTSYVLPLYQNKTYLSAQLASMSIPCTKKLLPFKLIFLLKKYCLGSALGEK